MAGHVVDGVLDVIEVNFDSTSGLWWLSFPQDGRSFQFLEAADIRGVLDEPELLSAVGWNCPVSLALRLKEYTIW